jgi:hypothetical protein
MAKDLEKIDEVTELENILKVWDLKVKILNLKAQYSAVKQAMNQTDGKKDNTLEVEEF